MAVKPFPRSDIPGLEIDWLTSPPQRSSSMEKQISPKLDKAWLCSRSTLHPTSHSNSNQLLSSIMFRTPKINCLHSERTAPTNNLRYRPSKLINWSLQIFDFAYKAGFLIGHWNGTCHIPAGGLRLESLRSDFWLRLTINIQLHQIEIVTSFAPITMCVEPQLKTVSERGKWIF